MIETVGTTLVAAGTPAGAPAVRVTPAAFRRAAAPPLAVSRLRCEWLDNPQGVVTREPRLSWIVTSPERDQRQTAYRILVASAADLLEPGRADLWDSGRVESAETLGIVYGGKPLGSGTQAVWRVQAFDRDGTASAWSDVATWTTGLLDEAAWDADGQAAWISAPDATSLHADRTTLHLPPARHYRREFTTAKPVKRAVLHGTALGLVEWSLDGRRVGDSLFEPGWTDYRLRVPARTHDVTALVEPGGPGRHCLAAVVADGWYAGYVGYGLLVGRGPHKTGRNIYGKTPAIRGRLDIEYADGTRESVVTDEAWQVTDAGPIREADFLMGETYDARREMPGWDTAGFDTSGADAAWRPAVLATASGSLKAPFFEPGVEREVELGFVPPPVIDGYAAPPIRVTQELPARSVREQAPGTYVFDMGQNFAGVVRLAVTAPAGTTIRLRFGEMLHPDGRLMTENLRRARAIDTYVCKGGGLETWTPRFTYHGFQFVELTGLPAGGPPPLATVTGLVLHNDTPLVGRFACSDDVLTKFWKNTQWTQRANFIEVPTDCPQRDERLGWMGDAQIYARTATFNADVAAFFTKWIADVREAQVPSGPHAGAYPDYAPYPFAHGKPGAVFGTAWTDAGVICPWTMWQVYGDTRLVADHWESMRRFMEWRARIDPALEGVEAGNTWGDWLNVDEATPIPFIDLCYHAQSARMMVEMADALGRRDEAAAYRERLGRLTASFAARYLRPDGTIAIDTQTACVLALEMGLVPPERTGPVVAQLVGRIEAAGGRMTTGFLGTKSILPVLSAHGHHDLACRLFQSREFPSWGYEVEQGANTVWERWDSFTKEHGFEGATGKNNAAMNSFSHYAFGAVMEWAFRDLAGIDLVDPGYGRILVRPRIPAAATAGGVGLDWVEAEYDGPRGRIASRWERVGDELKVRVSIPANTAAEIRLPVGDVAAVTEQGRSLASGDIEGVRAVRLDETAVVLEAGSGDYEFRWAAVAAPAAAAADVAADAVRPNIVLILADDLGWSDTSLYGTTDLYPTPNIRRLAARGITFSRAYAASPLCSPTRASIITGQTPARNGSTAPVHHTADVRLEPAVQPQAPPGDKARIVQSVTRLDTRFPTLGRLLRDAGYRTGHFGKWHLGPEPYSPLEHGFEIDLPHTSGPGPAGNFVAPWGFPNFRPGVAGEHIEDRMAAEASAWMETVKDEPFYLQYWQFSVHAPFDAKEELIDLYRGRIDRDAPQHSPTYAAMVHSLDDAVGTLLDTIDRLGIADRTLIVFTSDNGGNCYNGIPERAADGTEFVAVPTSNAPLRGGKATVFEGGIRVPEIVVWPGVAQPGSRTDAITQSTDLYPTLLHAAGVAPPADHTIDGVDIRPAIEGRPFDRGPIFTFFPHAPAVPDWLPPSVAVHRGDWKLIRLFHEGDDAAHAWRLYDLASDLGERHDLAASRPELVAELDAEIERHLVDARAVVPLPNPRFDPARSRPDLIGVQQGGPKVGQTRAERIKNMRPRRPADSTEKPPATTQTPQRPAAPTAVGGAAGPGRRPNVLVVFTDDHGWADLGLQRVDDDIRTPHIDALGRDGVRFTRGYVTAPQCVPSRAGLLTGIHQSRFGVEDNQKGPLPHAVVTLPERLRDLGYVTGMSGKWHLDISHERGRAGDAKTDPDYLPHRHGFDEYWCGSMRTYHASHALDGTPFPDAPRAVVDPRFRITVQTEAALGFLDRRAAEPERPWFLYVPYFAPHVPLEAAEPWFSRTPEHLPPERRKALAMIAAMDEGVGRLRDKLRELGQEQNTLIFCISDNGAPLKENAWDGSLNLPLVGEKGMLTDGGIRVPFLAAWPGTIPSGGEYDHPVSSLDVAATALSAAGGDLAAATRPRGDGPVVDLATLPLDGVDLVPFLTGQRSDPPHVSLFWRWRSQAAVLEYPWKLVRLGDDGRYLFNVTEPAGERVNLLAEHPEVATRLERALDDWTGTLRPPGPQQSLNPQDASFFAEHVEQVPGVKTQRGPRRRPLRQ